MGLASSDGQGGKFEKERIEDDADDSNVETEQNLEHKRAMQQLLAGTRIENSLAEVNRRGQSKQQVIMASFDELQNVAQKMGLKIEGNSGVQKIASELMDMNRLEIDKSADQVDENSFTEDEFTYSDTYLENIENDDSDGISAQNREFLVDSTSRKRKISPSDQRNALTTISELEDGLKSFNRSPDTENDSLLSVANRSDFEIDNSGAARRRLLAALDLGPPKHNGPTCDNCKRPASEEDIRNFGKCSLCRGEDLQFVPETSNYYRGTAAYPFSDLIDVNPSNRGPNLAPQQIRKKTPSSAANTKGGSSNAANTPKNSPGTVSSRRLQSPDLSSINQLSAAAVNKVRKGSRGGKKNTDKKIQQDDMFSPVAPPLYYDDYEEYDEIASEWVDNFPGDLRDILTKILAHNECLRQKVDDLQNLSESNMIRFDEVIKKYWELSEDMENLKKNNEYFNQLQQQGHQHDG